jgi:4-hydroxy-tetrahydrodipicolinate reductase
VINVCLAGATGWAGSDLARGIARTEDLALSSAVSRSHASQDLGDVLGEPGLSCPIYATAREALLAQPCDVFVEFTRPESARANVLTALERGVHVVVGTSGLTDKDYAKIGDVARNQERGVLACGNFALTAVLLQKFAEMAARLIPHWEIIDYAYDGKPDAPSGTVRELAARLATVRQPQLTIPVDQTVGEPGTRGATVSGSHIHETPRTSGPKVLVA